MRHEVAQGKHVVLVGDLNVVASADDIHPAIYPKGDPCFGYDAREIKVCCDTCARAPRGVLCMGLTA